MKKTRKRKQTKQTAATGPRDRFAHVDPAQTLETYGHPPRGSRLVAELEQLLTTPDIFASPIRDKAKWYLARLKDAYMLPRWYRFYPRDHVPAGGTPYDEESFRQEYFGTISPRRRAASHRSTRKMASSLSLATRWDQRPTWRPGRS
jgi:hypothetical protein